MEYSIIANIFQTKYLFSKAHVEENRKPSNRSDNTQYKKITHNPFVLFFKQKKTKEKMGKNEESKLIVESTSIMVYPNIESYKQICYSLNIIKKTNLLAFLQVVYRTPFLQQRQVFRNRLL